MTTGCSSNKLHVPDSARGVGDLTGAAMTEQDPLEVSLEDTELLVEVKLLAEVIVAATHAEEDLDQDEIDEVLDIGE
jgi:hypothetical protein